MGDARRLELLDHMDALSDLIAKVDKRIRERWASPHRRQFWMDQWEKLILTHIECEWRLQLLD